MAQAPKGPPTRHTAFIHARGGRQQLFQLKSPSQIKYSRERDDQSKASVTIEPTGRDKQLLDLLSIEPLVHELYIFRNKRLAWCGPVSLPTSRNAFGQFEVSAKDITMYLDRTAPHQAYNNAYPNVDYVVSRLQKMLLTELARKEAIGYNLIDHLHFYIQSGDARTSTKTAAYAMSLLDHLEDLAAKSGIDYTVYGRELHIWDTSRPAMGRVPTLGRNDFLDEPVVKKYGSELATSVIATDGQGGFGISGRTDPYYGEVELIVQAYDQDNDTKKPTVAELQAQSKLSLKGRQTVPISLSVPSNSSVSPNSLFTPELMVPGVYVPLRLEIGAGRTLTQMQKLQSVTITDDGRGEQVQISLYPIAQSDDSEAMSED